MATKRMFAKNIVQSGKFLKMPVSSRELYFQLGMSADDDGIVEAWNILKLTNANEDDLRVLVAKGYVIILNEDLISYLTDWNTNNSIRSDRYHESIYRDLLLRMPDETFENVNQVTTECQPSDNQCLPENISILDYKNISISSSNSINNINNINKEKPKKKKDGVRHHHGEYGHVLLTDAEYQSLLEDYGEDGVLAGIKNVDEYCQEKGKKYNDYNLTLRKWGIKAPKLKKDPKNKLPDRYADYE